MTFLQSIILGIVQGITEFLPISSSAHLVLIPYLLDWNIPTDQRFPFDVLVQMGTLIAIIIYYREDLVIIIQAMFKGIIHRKPFEQVEARTGWLSLLATIPAGVIGFSTQKLVEKTFNTPVVSAVFLFVTAGLLIIGEIFDKKGKDIGELTWKDALIIGAFQVLAIFPGVSRSGSTITGGMIRNYERKTAGQFSFLMAIPILLAASIIGLINLAKVHDLNNFLPVMIIGFLVSAIVGYFSISWLIGYLKDHSLLVFVGYCIFLGAGSLALIYFNPSISSSSDTGSAQVITQDSSYQIGVDPDLEWLLPAMNNCIQEVPALDLTLQQYAISENDSDLFDAYFFYGSSSAIYKNSYQIGENQLTIVVNSHQTMQQISKNAINSIFSGRSSSWQSVSEICSDCFPPGGPVSGNQIKIWSPPEDSILWAQFNNAYLENSLSSYAKIAPDSKTMKQIISADVDSIGLLPSGWLDDSVKALTVLDASQSLQPIPIIASTRNEPADALSSWIVCIQSALNP